MTFVISNPGSGPVDGATRDHAEINIAAFVAELGIAGVEYAFDSTNEQPFELCWGGGRWRYVLVFGGRICDVDMPGLPLERVRYGDGLNPWEFPRLFVDGNSWLWEFAINAARSALAVSEDGKCP